MKDERVQKINKAREENKWTVKIKNLLWELNLYWKLLCEEKNNDPNKTNLVPILPLKSKFDLDFEVFKLSVCF